MATIAEILLEKGAQEAAARRRQGEITGQMFQNLSNIAAQAGHDYEMRRQNAPRLALEQAAVNEANQRQQGQQVIDSALQPFMPSGPQPQGEGPMPATHPYLDDQTGLYDVPKLTNVLAAHGMGHLAPDLLKGVENINDSITKHQEAQKNLSDATTVMYGDMADGVLKLTKAGFPVDQALDHIAQPALATQRLSPPQYQQMKAQLLQLPPDQQQAALTSYMDQAAKIAPTKTVGKDAIEQDRYGRTLVSNIVPPQPTPSSLALAAAGGDPAKAVELLKPPKAPGATAEADDNRYRNIQAAKALGQAVSPVDAAWATGYEKQKTLGPEASAAAATTRQTATIQAQVDQQRRAQDFAALQAARGDLTKNVETPYATAKASADALRDAVRGAQSGNKIEASLQSLEATMATIRQQGLNRLNTTELGLPSQAGSLWDQIQNKLGKVAKGQPMNADLQKDMLDYANALDKQAYKKYKDSHAAVNKLYGTNIPETYPNPFVTMRAPNGQTQDVAPDQVEHYRSLGATVVTP